MKCSTLHCKTLSQNDTLGKKAGQFLQTRKTAGELQVSKAGIYCATNPKYVALAFAALLATETSKSKLLLCDASDCC